ncbi:protein fem-1 homolog A-A-like [Macrobrachium nipponense]|uniref:protein fem-1 homolog A-A-like n=1 Tax=Macrobrachium nipponense TaxID=159736 RepID=UPI0030C89681
MSMRYVNGVLIYPKAEDSLSSPTHEELSEVVTLHQLENIGLDGDAVQEQALLVMARVLGYGHLDTLRIIRRTGLDYATRLDFKRCINLTVHAIDMQRNHLNPLDHNRLFHFKSFIIFFKQMTNTKDARGNIYKPKEYFEEFLLAFEKCIEETELIICELNCTGVYRERSHVCHLDQFIHIVLHLLVPFVRLQPDITDHQCHTFKRALHKIVKMEPRGYMGAALLHYSCSEYFKDIDNFIQPVSASNRAEVVDLLLETGADPSVTGRDGNTALHELAKNKECPKGVVDALLSGGVHLDAMNSQGQTFASLRASRGQPVSQLVNVVRHTSLQCLAAASIRRHGIPYKDVLPSRLVKFVDMH